MSGTRSSPSKKILLITNVDSGEANVFLETTRALLEQDVPVQLHFASFGKLEEPVVKLGQDASSNSPASTVTFHAIRGPTMEEAIRKTVETQGIETDGHLPKSFVSRLRLSTTMRAIRDSTVIFFPYDGPDLVQVVGSIQGIIQDVEPDLVVVNSLMTPALTACFNLGVKFVVLSPNSPKQFCAGSQPKGQILWKFPALFSGFSYPVPWYLIPLNIFILLYIVKSFRSSHHCKQLTEYFTSQTGSTVKTPLDLIRNPPPNLKILVGSLLELDFPITSPEHIIPCGPIIRSSPPLAETDPTLAQWLSRGPTVYINLGSICKLDEDRAVELAAAVKDLLDAATETMPEDSKMQVLWKLSRDGEYAVRKPESRIETVFREELQSDRVRIVDWLDAQPSAVLRSGHILCSVHHGGANSFHEAIVAGIPQVVLPQWTDCYDYAERVRILGVGRVGNPTMKPLWSAKELSRELKEVVLGKGADMIKTRARELADICQAKGDGALNAARCLLEECPGKTVGGVANHSPSF